MKVVSVEQMQQLDTRAIEEHKIPGENLMENAGTKVARVAEKIIDRYNLKEKALLFAGKGNNGGDAFVAARILIEDEIQATTILLCNEDEVKGDAKLNLDRLLAVNGHVIRVTNEEELDFIRGDIYGTDLIIDGIFGIGIHGAVQGYLAKVIDLINESEKKVISIDIPSGLNGDTGFPEGACIKADETVTMGLPKMGLLRAEGLNYVGKIHIGKIGLPDALLNDVKTDTHFLVGKELKGLLPKRPRVSHKGDYGKILVVAGSVGYTGAAAMAAMSALRGGSGLVTLAVPSSLNDILEQKLTEVITAPVAETPQRTFSPAAVAELRRLEKENDVVLIGPGISRHPETGKMLAEFLPNLTKPAVIDADALNLLSENMGLLKKIKVPLVLTPHPGEMARLTGKSVKEVNENSWEIARDFAKKHKVVLVLKGAGTVVAEPGGDISINSTGNPGMATAGTGDVLAGLIASFIGQGLSPADAAKLGVYIHGEAGDAAAEEVGEHSLVATDLLWAIPKALRDFTS